MKYYSLTNFCQVFPGNEVIYGGVKFTITSMDKIKGENFYIVRDTENIERKCFMFDECYKVKDDEVEPAPFDEDNIYSELEFLTNIYSKRSDKKSKRIKDLTNRVNEIEQVKVEEIDYLPPSGSFILVGKSPNKIFYGRNEPLANLINVIDHATSTNLLSNMYDKKYLLIKGY